MRQQAPLWVAAKMLVAGLLGALLTAGFVFLIDYGMYWVGSQAENNAEPIFGGSATAGLRYKVWSWVTCGLATGFAVYASRTGWFVALKLDRFEEKIPKFIKLPHEYVVLPSAFNHLMGGLASGLMAAIVWHLLNLPVAGRFLFGARARLSDDGLYVWGLSLGIPPDLYAGWIRVLSDHRYGQRLPIMGQEEVFSERFLGHFPGDWICLWSTSMVSRRFMPRLWVTRVGGMPFVD